jgi:lipid A ethanolaminephosphotransferase
MKSISSTKLIILASVLLILFYNITFFTKVIEVYPANAKNIGFLISLAVLFASITTALFSLTCFKYSIKPVLIVMLIASAGAAYFMDTYNVVIDSTMIDNIIKTDPAEAMDLFSLQFVLYLLLLGILPAVVIYKTRINYQSVKAEILSRLKSIAGACALSAIAIFLFSDFYASFLREHKPLRYYENPVFYLYSINKYVSEYFEEPPGELVPIAEDATLSSTDKHRELVIFVVGETARADHFSLNGYKRKTNPLLEKRDLVSFSNFWSCGTSTAHSLPCIFSSKGREAFDKSGSSNTENVLDVLQRVGVSVLWLDNNSDSKGVALRVPHVNFRTSDNNPVCNPECRDVGMLPYVQSYINNHPTGDIFIVLHQMGNHGPAYYKRYPDSFRVFKPACETNQLEKCSTEEIDNAYDNAILYTDYFLSKTIDLLDSNKKDFESTLIYVSDHGESLGEKGLYLHGLPYIIAPDVQKHVPAIMWFGNSFDLRTQVNYTELKKRKNERFSHDNLFHTILGLMEVKTSAYDKTLDIIHHHEN